MDVHKALKYLENLDVSSEDDLSYNDDFVPRGWLIILSLNEESDKGTEVEMSFSQTI